MLVKPEIYLKANSVFIHGNIRYETVAPALLRRRQRHARGDEESFTPRILTVQLGLKRRIVGSLFAGLQYDFEKPGMEKVEPGGILDTAGLIGSDGGMFSGFGLSLDWDTRDAVLFPRRGVFVQTDRGRLYRPMAGSDSATPASSSTSGGTSPSATDRVLAVQAYLHATSGDVPFHRLALLGGESLVRGYYKGRFRDKGLLALQAEYRVLVTKRIGVAGFAGLADVFPGFGDFRVEKLKYSLGSGLRYVINTRDGTTVRAGHGLGPGLLRPLPHGQGSVLGPAISVRTCSAGSGPP